MPIIIASVGKKISDCSSTEEKDQTQYLDNIVVMITFRFRSENQDSRPSNFRKKEVACDNFQRDSFLLQN